MIDRSRCLPAFALAAFLSLSAALSAEGSPTVAVSDLQVNSSNSSYAYLGKGFAEIIAFELSKSPSIRIVDREQRNAALKEMEFALSGLADESNQLQAGKLLSVRYIVYGSITDMAGTLLVSLKALDVETSQVVWSDQVTEPSGRYAQIGAFFATSFLRSLRVSVASSTQKAASSSSVADTAAVVALSAGLDALDSGKKSEAKARLQEAARLDPSSGVVAAFLGRLASVSAKFKVVPERYVSYWNPAYLGGLAQDRLSVSANSGWPTWGFADANNGNQLISRDSSNEWGVGETRNGFSLDYLIPLGSSFGIGTEYVQTGWKDSVVEDTGVMPPVYAQQGNQYSDFLGGNLSLGWKVGPQFSLGLGFLGAYLQRHYFTQALGIPNGSEYYRDEYPVFGGVLAALLKNPSGTLSWDFMASWSSEPQYWFDTSSYAFSRYAAPIYAEQTLTAVLGGKAFLALKQVNDLYPDRNMAYIRAMPMFELWVADIVGLRLGAEGSLVLKSGDPSFGLGGTAGLSLKFWKLSVDLNYTFRQRPSRSLDGVYIPE